MNKNGKSYAIFLILIPVFLVLTIIIVDTMISYSENKRFKKVTENIITEVINNEELDYDEYYKEIKRLYEFNNYETEMLVVDASEYSVMVENEHYYFGLISSLINKNGEDATINIFGVEFKAKKSSRAIVNVEASYNYDDELEFEYIS